MNSPAELEERAEVRRALQSQLLKCLSAVGKVAARENTERGAEFKLPATRATNQAFLTLARGMLKKATEQKELLVSRGMSQKLLDDLAAGLTQFDSRFAQRGPASAPSWGRPGRRPRRRLVQRNAGRCKAGGMRSFVDLR